MRAPTDRERRSAAWGRALRAAVRVVRTTVLVIAVPLVVYLWPSSLGGRSTIVFVSGESMLPTISTDDVVVARSADDYAIGDVVVIEIPEGEPGAGERIIHRLVGGSSTTGWFTQGDNRDYPDQWMLTRQDIVGRARVIAPFGDEARLLFRMMLWPVVWGVAAAVGVFRLAWRRLGAAAGASTINGDEKGASDAGSTVDGRRTGGWRQLVGWRRGRQR